MIKKTTIISTIFAQRKIERSGDVAKTIFPRINIPIDRMIGYFLTNLITALVINIGFLVSSIINNRATIISVIYIVGAR